MNERIFTREDVSHIVRERVKQLNERVQELEIEIIMTRIEAGINEAIKKEEYAK